MQRGPSSNEAFRKGLTQGNWCPYEKGKVGHRRTEGRPCEDTERGRRVRVTERGFERKTPASTLILDAQPPGLGGNEFLGLEPPVHSAPSRPRASKAER